MQQLFTREGEELKGTPWQAYPRPQMVRPDWLCLNGIDATSWIPYIESAPIRAFSATDAFNDETFSSFIQSHPDLEELHIPWNEEIHDLTGLLDMPNLRYVKISFPMKEAIRSLEGQSYGFELEIEGQ